MGFPATTTGGEAVEIVKTEQINGVKTYIDALGNKYVPSLEPLKLELVEAVEAVGAGADSVGAELAEAADEIGAEISEAKDEIGDAIEAAVESISEEVGDVVEAASDLADEAVEAAKDAIEDATEALEDVFGQNDEEPAEGASDGEDETPAA